MVKKQFFKSPNLVVHKSTMINTDFENDIVHLFDAARSEHRYFQLPMNPFFLTWGNCLNWRAMLFNQFNCRGATRKECKTEFYLSMNVFLRYPPGLKLFCAE